jgi:hydroxypyruvate isomerase
MRRRDFIHKGAVAAAVFAGIGGRPDASPAEPVRASGDETHVPTQQPRFNLDYAPHFRMFRNIAGDDLLDQIRFMHDQGFRSLEDNNMRTRPVEEQEAIGGELQRLGMRMGVFVANSNGFGVPSFSSGDEEHRARFLADCRDSVEVARRVNARWMTVVMGDLAPRLEMDYQTANAVESLRRAAEIFEPHGLIMVLEPLNPFRDHPGMFLSKIPQAYLICRAVDSPSCKILFDIYHQQITEGNLIPNVDMAWDEIAYFQIGDNPGRDEPTTGEINYKNVFRHIHSKGYTGVLGMEHGNSQQGAEGERAVLAAYREVDDFM